MENQDSIQNGLPIPLKDSVAPSVENRTTDAGGDSVVGSIRSSPPPMPNKALDVLDAIHGSPEEKATKSDSEAETIVLPGKNGYSPSKTRKTIKHEDQSGGEEGEICEDNEIRDGLAELKQPNVPSSSGNNMYSSLGKRKRSKQGKIKDDQTTLAGNSSGLSSVPTSPVASRPKTVKNDSDHSRSPSPHDTLPRKANSVDPVISRQIIQGANSEDEEENRKRKRQQSVGGRIGPPAQHQHENHRTSKSQPKSGEKSRKHTRSESPPPRTHRRISSAQTSSTITNGLSHKKKRVPAPLLATRDRQSADYHSDESSASGSPHPRSSRLRKLATPATGESSHSATMPPGKMTKNRRDGIGRTPLARACATDDFNVAKEILDSSLEDINIADNAGNTPLQIACLEGHADVVKLLIDHGCDINCVNLDKDTPLLDAVENGHLDVVRLLIDAGVNPRRGNVKGEEPLDRIPQDVDNSEEIREALIAARLKSNEIRRPSEDLIMHDLDDHVSRGTNSPRPSPPMQLPEDSSYTGHRRRTNVRSTKTSNKLLHQSMDTKTLRAAAEVGDTETVNRILQVRDGMADTESLVLACRGGHEDVIQFLLAIGGADADPPPLPSKSGFPPDAATPMLAAIGREKIEVVKLLLDQPNFDPTRTFKGETYFEIARRRQGGRWKEEEEILREAHKKYTGSKQSSGRPRSPEVRRDLGKRSNDRTENTKSKVPIPDVLHNDPDSKRKINGGTIAGANREPKKSSPTTDTQLKLSPSVKKATKYRKDEHIQSTQLSERDSTGLGPPRPKSVKKRSESVTPHPSSDNDPVKPRRKLISGKELKGEKEKQRRESVASTAPNSIKDRSENKVGDLNKTDTSISRSSLGNISNYVEPDLGMDKIIDRPRTLKRDDSKDRLGAIRGESPSKRPRESSTPPRAGSQDSNRTTEDSGVPAKKRRLDSEGHASSSPDSRTNSSLLSSENGRNKANSFTKERHRQGSMASQGHGKPSEGHSEAKKNPSQSKRPTSSPSSSQDNHKHVEKASSAGLQSKGQRESVESKDGAKATDQKAADEMEAKIKAEDEERSRQEAEKAEADRKRLEEERLAADELKRKEAERAAAEELKRKEAERIAAEELKRQEAEKAEAEERARREAQAKLEEEKLKQQRAEMERQAMLAEKRAREEEQARELEAKLKLEAKLRQEEAERKERQAREDAEARQRAEEENRRIYLEQEQKKREEAERKRAAREAEVLAERERQEAERRAKLPQLLQSFEAYPNPQTLEFASLFKEFWGIRYDTIKYDATGPEAKELWILNIQVAFLLGLNDKHDLQLSRFTGWERVPASDIAKNIFCRVDGDCYACTSPALRFLNPEGVTRGMRTQELRDRSCDLFKKLDLFFVKLSDFMYMVPNYPHLRNIKMSVRYKELPKPDGSEFDNWRQDPAAGPFCPQRTYYQNGQFVGEDKPTYANASSTRFPRTIPSAPRDPENGLLRITAGSPRYLELCRAQGLWHLLPAEERETALSNGNGNGRPFTSNGDGNNISFTPSPSVPSESGKSQPQYMEDAYGSPRLVNGINGDT